ncbi:conjugal transfer protein, partial [Vibrio artabrorum]
AVQGFDAMSKMKALKKSGNQAVIDIERGVEHYDEVTWSRSEQDQSVSIRSNVYLTRTLIKGGRHLPPEKLVLSVLWQLKDKAALAKEDLDTLRLNPIGLTILSYQLNKERT